MAHSSVTWLIHMWHGSFIRVTWLIHMCNGSFICVMAHSYVTRLIHVSTDSSLRVTRLIHMWDMTQDYMWHDSFICAIGLFHMCNMCILSRQNGRWSLCTHECVRAVIFVCGVGWLERLPAPELRNHTVAEHACSKMGHAAARRNAPKQPRMIRVGPNEGAKKLGSQYRGFVRFSPHTGGLSVFLDLPGVYRIFNLIPGVCRIFNLIPGFIGSATKNPGFIKDFKINPRYRVKKSDKPWYWDPIFFDPKKPSKCLFPKRTPQDWALLGSPNDSVSFRKEHCKIRALSQTKPSEFGEATRRCFQWIDSHSLKWQVSFAKESNFGQDSFCKRDLSWQLSESTHLSHPKSLVPKETCTDWTLLQMRPVNGVILSIWGITSFFCKKKPA